LDEIKANWPDSSLEEKQTYVLELDATPAGATELRSIPGTKL